MTNMVISSLIPFLEKPGSMLEMEEERQKLHMFFTDTLPKLVDADLHDAYGRKIRRRRDCLKISNKVVYEVDGIVDDFRYAGLQADAEAKAKADGCRNWNGDRVRAGFFLFSCFKNSRINRSGVLQGIEYRIGSVMKKIDRLVELITTFDFQLGHEINITVSAEMPQQLIFSSPTEIVGRDKEKEAIVNQLLNPPPRRHVLSICGQQGIGKTALVRSICNDVKISNFIDHVLWVEGGPRFNIGKVKKSIVDQLIGKDCCIPEGNLDLDLRLFEELAGKRCILVLDEVSCEGYWELVNNFNFHRSMSSGSSVIHTCSYVEGGGKWSHTLHPLMLEDGWTLFCKKVFLDAANENCGREILEGMGKEILVRCGGSPLAVNMMGGLMRFKKEPEEWRRVINQLNKEELDKYGAATVETIIKVCYDNLCSQVKQCFAFCSFFPNGHYMDKEVLIKLWMANGLLLPSDESRSMSLEEKGQIVFNELVLRNFFEDVKFVPDGSYENKHGYHSRVTFKLLDLIYEQAVIAAKEFALLIAISDDSRVDIPMLLHTNSAIRMLLLLDDPFSRTVNCSDVPKANSLRGLQLPSASFERNILELKYMKHLRYLDLSGSRIKTLPESTSLLYFLQTLNLSKCLLLYQLPENMKYMSRLRHLYTHKCPKLMKMPAHLSLLSNLQTLTAYIVGEKIANTGIDEIKGLHLSGLLELYNLHKVKTAEIAKEADLTLKTNLDRLTLCWGSEQLVMPKENNDLAVLEELRPHDQLKVLKIQQYGGRKFATWLANPMAKGLINLVELHLIGCSKCETLPVVWKLLSLRVLCLKHMPSLTCISRINEKDSSEIFFPSLKRLVLVGLKKLERWNKEEENKKEEEEEEGDNNIVEINEDGDDEGGGGSLLKTMPHVPQLKTTFEEVVFTMLDELEITSCPNLKTMPHVPKLKHIAVNIENYMLLQSVTDAITQSGSLVEEANISKASDASNEPFPALGAEVKGRVNKKLRIMRMDSTNSVFMPTTLSDSLLGLWGPFQNLQFLEIINCNTLVSWPLEFRYLKRLMRLSIRNCPKLTGIPPAQAKKIIWMQLPELRKLEFYGCSSLKHVPIFEKLTILELDECPKVESVIQHNLNSMQILYLSCTDSDSDWIFLRSELETIVVNTLWVSECYSLMSLPEWLARESFVEYLIINDCPLLKKLPGDHKWLSSLKKLQISKCPDLENFCKQEPYASIISQIHE